MLHFLTCRSTEVPIFSKSDPDVSLQSLRWGQRPVLRLGPAVEEMHHPGRKRPDEPVGAEYHQMPGELPPCEDLIWNILAPDRTYLTSSHLIEATHTRHLNQSPLAAYLQAHRRSGSHYLWPPLHISRPAPPGPWCTFTHKKKFGSRTTTCPLASCQRRAGRHSHANAFSNMRGHLQPCIRAISVLSLHYKPARSSLQPS